MHVPDKTDYFTGKPQFKRAQELLKEAGYDGTPVVLMLPADMPSLNKYPPVMAELLRRAGFKVDLQSMDWATLVTRRTKSSPVSDLWTTHPLSSGLPLFLIPELRAVSGNLRQPEVKCFAYK